VNAPEREPVPDARAGLNADQARLAEHLIATTRDRLAGRDETGNRLVDVRPRERVVLGVLSHQPPPVMPEPPSAADVPHEPGVPIDHLPASEIGLTALIAPTDSNLRVRVRAQFALYLQHAPTHPEQAAYSGIEDPEPLPPVEGADGGDVEDPHGVNADRLPPPPAPADLANLPPDAAAAVQLAVQGAHDDANGVRRNAASDFLRPVYQRYDVKVAHELVVPLPHDARPHTAGEQIAYTEAIGSVVQEQHPQTLGGYAGNLLVPLRGNSAVRVPRSVVEQGTQAYETYLRDHARDDWVVVVPTVAFRVTVQRTPVGPIRLALTLVNTSQAPERDRGYVPEMSIYDASFSADVGGGDVVPTEYRLVERDYRTDPRVYAHGRFCCLDEDAFAANGSLTTTTLPVHRQLVYESKPELQPTFRELAEDPVPALERIQDHMRLYLTDWDSFLELAGLDEVTRIACDFDRLAFADELRRFSRGVDLVRQDVDGARNGLGAAFARANEAFALMNTEGGLDSGGRPTAESWRLFQVVYVVANLTALAARVAPAAERRAWVESRHTGDQLLPSQDLDELAIADVLWFPTGGGKSAALYGIVAVAMFFDRLRGKDAGITSMIRFPLRMLSVQQLERILRLVAACERVRTNHGDPGSEFRLGYWVGRANTPNRLTDPTDQRWHDIAWMAEQGDQWKRNHVVIPACPFCGGSQVVLEPDVDRVILAHRCRSCQRLLPVDVSDDEIYRHLPSVIVATVDKIASLGFNSHASHLTHGPAFHCPDHGYVTHPLGSERRCLARGHCSVPLDSWQLVAIHDPAPALVIQDELHLLGEELGTFAAHYETLWQHLCVAGSGLPSKVLAATATISDYENQVEQLYALRPRRFPTDGWQDGDSFYARRHNDLIRRIFVGALPTQMDVVDFSIAAGEAVRDELRSLARRDPVEVCDGLGLANTAPERLSELLFRYELQAYYCNRKTHADRVNAHAERAGTRSDPGFRSVRLNGQTPLAEISEVIRRVERETLDTPPSERLASIAGTSLISHGVDLARLNLLFVLGMPSTVAYYVQATSRAGRTDVGIVFTSLARHFVRDRSVFHFFDTQHRYVNVLVEPVALNRFSTHGPRKTASGIVAALITQEWARDDALLALGNMTAPCDLTRADTVRRLIGSLRAAAEQNPVADPVVLLQEQARRSYGLGANVLDLNMSQRFAESVDQQVVRLVTSIEAAHETLLTRSLRPRPPMSLRDVDASAEFGTANYAARRRFEFLDGAENENDEADFAVANEED
jgi:hypothetical protein